MFRKFLGSPEGLFSKSPFGVLPVFPYKLDCSVREMMSSWRERERVVKRAE